MSIYTLTRIGFAAGVGGLIGMIVLGLAGRLNAYSFSALLSGAFCGAAILGIFSAFLNKDHYE